MDPTPNAPGYRDLPAELAALARRIRSHARRSTKTLLALGKDLNAAQAILEDHRTLGSFSGLIEKAGLSRSQAYRALSVWRSFGDCPESGHQPSEVLTTLSSHPEAVAEGLTRFASGDRLTIKEAREILATVRPSDPTTVPEKTVAVFQYEGGSVSVVANRDNATNDDIVQLLARALRETQQEDREAKPRWGWKAA